jgi:hypothetical protein
MRLGGTREPQLSVVHAAEDEQVTVVRLDQRRVVVRVVAAVGDLDRR